MNTNQETCNHSEFTETVNPLGLAHTVRTARLNFLGPIALFCALGCVARCIQALLVN